MPDQISDTRRIELKAKLEEATYDTGRLWILPRPLTIILLCLMGLGVIAFVFYIYSFAIGQWVLEPVTYYYLLFLLFSPCVFLMMPARKRDRQRIPWYDYALAALAFVIFFYFVVKSDSISRIGWVPAPDAFTLILAAIIALMSLESGRRLGGLAFIIICVIFGVYPLFATFMPDWLWGASTSLDRIISAFAYGNSGIIGLPAQVSGEQLIGYLIFSGVLTGCGAGDFFINMALALLGRFRGGPAKVCVFASCLFGTLTGSAIAEVATVGNVTIKLMKRTGYPAHYAAGIEAVAANGGAIMPPVMGAIIFIMAVITGIPYATIVVAAILPAILYYWGLLVQVDAYASKVGLKGLPREELPSARAALKMGWPFIFGIVFLALGLVYFQWGVKSALYASALLIVASFANRATRMNGRKMVNVLANTGSQITQVMSILMPVGFIMLGFELTGSLTRLTIAITSLASTSVIAVLLLSVVISFVFGMIGISFLSYLILAVTVIPSIVQATGMSIIGLHFFMIWWLLVGAINPPVAVLAFIAAAVADAPPMKTAWTATRLAAVTYFIPFFFVYQPALLFEGPIWVTIYSFLFCVIGIYVLCSGLEGYIPKAGRLGWLPRVLFVIGGFCIALPEWISTVAGFALTAAVFLVLYMVKRRKDNVASTAVV